MAAPRRIGALNSATRALILDATEQIMLEEGYAAASTRRVAAQAGLKPVSIEKVNIPRIWSLVTCIKE